MGDKPDNNRQRLYSGPVFSVEREGVELPDGRRFDLDIVRHHGGAAVVALDQGDRLCLLRQYRHVADGFLWELPAGKRTPGEPPLCTAQRELREEAGLAARNWLGLGTMHSSPGVFSEVIHLYLATDLSPLPARPEDDEFIEVHWVPLEKALAWAGDDTITDAKTVIGLYRAHALIR